MRNRRRSARRCFLGPMMWLLLLLVAITAAQPAQAVGVGERAPDISRKDLLRERFRLADLVGPAAKDPRRAVIVVFANPKTDSSRRELHELSKLDYEWSPLGVEIVHVGLRVSKRQLNRLVGPVHIPWRAVTDRRGKIAAAYGVDKAPHLFVVNAAGVVTFTSDTYSPERYEQVRSALVATTGAPAPWGSIAKATPLFLRHRQTYLFGRPPTTKGASARWQPLAALLENAARAHFKMVDPSTYEAFEQGLIRGDFAVANASPAVAQRLVKLYEPIAGLERHKENTYYGVIFTTRDSGIFSLQDLRGKTVAMVSSRSSSGGVYPFDMLLKAGLEPGVDVTLKWMGSHENVAEAVRGGTADAGACFQGCRSIAWGNDASRDRATRVIGLTERIPGDMIVVRRDLPVRVKQRLRRVINGSEAERVVLRQVSFGEVRITGIRKATDASLVSVGRLLKRIGPALEKQERLTLKQ